MKKTLLLLLGFISFMGACSKLDNTFNSSEEVAVPAPVAYTDWDRAIRVDTDMQTMYASTPRKIEKPIDLYMAMALALKYNYTRRVVSYQQSLVEVGKSPANRLPEIFSSAGYVNPSNRSVMDSELKLAWNILDIGTVYYQTQDAKFQSGVAYEQSRKVIHNLLQETRVLYWKTLTAQRLLPVIDAMIEHMTLDVDELNARAKELSMEGKALSMADLVKKRKYMEAVKQLSAQKRELETSEIRLASLLGFHPSTEYRLVGKEYGNFELPDIKSSLSEMEWLALTNRPELRVRDMVTDIEEVKASFKVMQDPGAGKYRNNSAYYNQSWAKQAKSYGLSIFEDMQNPSESDLENLRRQRMTNLILSQVYVAWARYMSGLEDYQLSHELANVSEDIAEDITITNGSRAEKSQLESAKAIEDEVNAMLAYADLQDALGNLYSTLGMDAIPYYMLGEKPSKIAIYLRGVLEKWKHGEFLPDNRPYLLNVPTKRPPVNLSSSKLMPDVTVESGQQVSIKIPNAVINKMDFDGNIIAKAGLIDDSPLPDWLFFDEKKLEFTGTAMPGAKGEYIIKVYFADENGTTGYITFKIKIVDVYVPSLKVTGLTPGRKATILKRCVGPQCTDTYINEEVIGNDVVKTYNN
ncbi:MAG: hypothetical protein E7012_06430 [Alphaproteobacteria bacterium]|nr:hypothetical protein [Alphaproteobacteria bacterium]